MANARLTSRLNDGSQAAPLADLRSAFDMISIKGGKNDTIKIQPGNYTGDRNHSFESGSYNFQNPESISIVIMGMGANPSDVVFSGNEDNYRGFIEVPPFKKVTFQNFTIRQMFNGSDDKSGGAAIAYRRNNSDLLVDNMRFIKNLNHTIYIHNVYFFYGIS